MLHAVIMAGGAGTRFWPLSRKDQPKQLLALTGEQTMIQQTVARCEGWIPAKRIWIITNETLADEIAKQLPQVPRENILCEPIGRNTAPAIGLAAVHLLQDDPEAVMLVMPSDHVIQTNEVFQKAAQEAVKFVEQNPAQFLLFGVPPTYPATGFGYIEPRESAKGSVFEVKSFKEKPDRTTAEKYVKQGNFYWNCGIFVWNARMILQALQQFEPTMYSKLRMIGESLDTNQADEKLKAIFPQMKSISIDYAVLERAETVKVIEAPFQWDDVGSWLAISRLLGTNDDKNTLVGNVTAIQTKDCIIRSSSDHLIATFGMENCIIVHTPDATLVARKDDENGVREIVEFLKKNNIQKYL